MLSGDWQVHHIIPVALAKKNDIVQKAINEGFDFNGAINGIPLDKTKHLGDHSDYTNGVEDIIESMRKERPDASAREIMESATKEIRDDIQSTTGKINDMYKK